MADDALIWCSILQVCWRFSRCFFEVAVRSPEGVGNRTATGEPAARCSITAGEEFRPPRMVQWT